MCGIAGIITKNAPTYAGPTKRMLDALIHRGPDANGLAIFDSCILGHRRLSIVDLSTGAQPMYDTRKTVAVTFNGEIYGYQALRDQLSPYPFHTSSDTEVILAMYKTHGKDFVRALPGMFAFALWDDASKTLIAARDRFGEKPLYYAFGSNGEFIFASEIKAILSSDLVQPILNPESLSHYLHKLYVHPSKTIYKNIYTLPAAHTLVYTDGHVSISRYWKLPEIQDRISLTDATLEFKQRLTESVRKQLVADVPVGAFLSGGLDSTTIVSIASRIHPRLKTFAFGFEGTKNELSFARAAATHYGTEHYELHDTDYDVADLLERMTTIYDEPFADSSNIPTFLISRETRKHATVVLTGDGGDELLGGYGWYKSLLGMETASARPIPGQLILLRILAQIALRTRWKHKTNIITKARSLYYKTHYQNALDAHRASNVFFKHSELNALGLNEKPTATIPSSWTSHNTVDDAMRDDLEDYLTGDILVKVDRASMANSLELRAPFLDVDVAEFAASLPHRLKLDSSEDKILLRRAFEETWPDTIRTRSKLGFGAPVDIWMRKPAVATLIHEYLNDPQKKIFDHLSFERSRRYLDSNDYKTWILLTLSMWMERHSYATA